MLSLIQRVTQASVSVDGEVIGRIGPGLLALVAVEPGDHDATFRRMAERLLGYRVFADTRGRMNRSLRETAGGLLLVSQFTLAADTDTGMRPSFTAAAPLSRLNTVSIACWSCAGRSTHQGWKVVASVPIW